VTPEIWGARPSRLTKWTGCPWLQMTMPRNLLCAPVDGVAQPAARRAPHPTTIQLSRQDDVPGAAGATFGRRIGRHSPPSEMHSHPHLSQRGNASASQSAQASIVSL
jgi:hypothetical protein